MRTSVHRKVRAARAFFYGQNFFDGVKLTIGVLLPALLFSQMGQLQTGITVSLGAIGASLADAPGPLHHKRNGMLVAIVACTAVAFLTGFARLSPVGLGLEILMLSFVCSMVLVYGMRASLIGLAALLVMVLTMGQPLAPEQVPGYSLLIMAGGAWYLLLSLLSAQILPYRPAQQALGEGMLEVAAFLRIKASFYRPSLDVPKGYQQLIAQQVVVNEKQAAVRELLFKGRQLVKESTPQGRALVLTFVDLMDLYEQITAIHYDYAALGETYRGTGILAEIAALVEKLADELEDLGFQMQANAYHARPLAIKPLLENLKKSIDALALARPDLNTLVLKRILVNIRSIGQRLSDIHSYFTPQTIPRPEDRPQLEGTHFVSNQDFSWQLLLSNLSLESSVFRFSLRVALVAFFTFLLLQVLPLGHHSYWVLLTVIFLLKPAFSLTKQRNTQRIIGTLVGGAIGLLVLFLVENQTAQFAFMLVFMTAFFSLQRTHYQLSVMLMTPFVLILFNFLGAGSLAIVQERVVDTLIGCAIAFSATYFLFPNWESRQVRQFLVDALKANQSYLQVLASGLAGEEITELQYKLARKEVYVSSANLSAAFQRMAAEPKSKQRSSEQVYELVVLNHVLASYIATMVAGGQIAGKLAVTKKGVPRTLRRAQYALAEAIGHLEPGADLVKPGPEAVPERSEEAGEGSEEGRLYGEQLEFIRKVSADINRLSQVIQPTEA